MRNVSRILYLVGLIFGIIYLVSSVTLAVLGIVAISNAQEIYDYFTQNATDTQGLEITVEIIKGFGVGFVVASIFEIVFTSIGLAIRGRAVANLEAPTNSSTPHILAIVFGALSGNYLLVAAGITGVIAR